MRVNIASVILICLFCVRAILAQDLKSETWDSIDSIPEVKAAELGSFYDALWANNSSWQSGDVLINVSYFSDSTKLDLPRNGNLILEVRNSHRFRFDYEKGHFLYLRSYKRDIPLVVFPDETTAPIDDERRIRGFVVNNEGTFIREVPQKMKKATRQINIDKLFRQFHVPELRAAGITNFESNASFESLQRVIPRLSSGEGINHVTEIDGDTIRWNRKTALPGKDNLFFFEETVFDVKRLVPSSNRLFVDSMQNNKLVRGEQYHEKLEWGEIHGIQVPTVISKTCLSDHKIGDHLFVCEMSIELSVIWLGLNSKMENSEFDQGILQEIDTMVKMVDEASLMKQSLLPVNLRFGVEEKSK